MLLFSLFARWTEHRGSGQGKREQRSRATSPSLKVKIRKVSEFLSFVSKVENNNCSMHGKFNFYFLICSFL